MKKVVFLGNPNVGKSALINAISGSKIKVGNWPGVTIEKNHANYTYNNEEISLIDLPGAYQLDNVSTEERITSEVLLEGDYDLIINVLDTTNLERNLYMTLLARELQKPMLILLNFEDQITKKGVVIDTVKLQRYLQAPIIRTSAMKATGIDAVKDFIANFDPNEKVKYNIYYSSEIDIAVNRVQEILTEDNIKAPSYGLSYLSYRLFEKNATFTNAVPESTLVKINETLNSDKDISLQSSNYNQLQQKRYDQIHKVLKEVVDNKGVSRYNITRKIDNIVLNKWLGLPILLLFTIYFLSLIFNVANPFVDWIDGFIGGYVTYYVGLLVAGAPDWFQSMILDGIIGGIGGVLVFTPLMYFIYLLMGILEESGIMSRIAFLMDRIMTSFGLNGKSFISMVIGFGCTVPAITSTKALETEAARKKTALMLPFISCGARLPVYALFATTFFSRSVGLVVASLYVLGIVVAVIIGLLMKAFHIYDSEEQDAFTIELPPYRIPERRILFKNVNSRIAGFLRKVTTLIMAVLFIVWAANYFPTGEAKDSYLTKATHIIKPIFAPTGFGDSDIAIAALPTSIAAKEAVVGTIKALAAEDLAADEEEVEGVPEEATISYQAIALKDAAVSSVKSIFLPDVAGLFAAPTDDEEVEDTVNAANHMFTGENAPLKAYSYMVFILLLLPCVVAIATIKKEFGWKFMWQVVAVTLIVPYIVSTIVFQLGNILFY
ncbi:ferrous iron transport protein B [Mycoplasma sp. P36-A1]|uniref:ferrous iron transport protein B n=1 Tax=Mycoplasma sp. P36-A1 TaxID=3252900 RepID=UPI003C2C30A2